MRQQILELVTGFLVVQLLLLSNQVNAVKNRPRKQRSRSEKPQAQQPNSDYNYDYYENYDYEEKNGEYGKLDHTTIKRERKRVDIFRLILFN